MASTLYEFYKSQGQALPSLQTRAGLYQQYGLGSSGSYSGGASQNTALLNALQGGGAPSAPVSTQTTSAPAPAPSSYEQFYQQALATQQQAIQPTL